jgi:hypothetical protein
LRLNRKELKNKILPFYAQYKQKKKYHTSNLPTSITLQQRRPLRRCRGYERGAMGISALQYVCGKKRNTVISRKGGVLETDDLLHK